jgi:hypothetical protein
MANDDRPKIEGRPNVVDGYLVRLHGPAWGMALGLLFGTGLLLATLILVLKGGPHVGQHLGLLRQYLPFYSVSVVGALIGFVEGFVIGWATGALICFVYNRATRL